MNTILFDLDGTLLPMDMELFENLYFQELGKAFSDMISPQELISLIWGSTKVMVGDISPKTNEEIFMEDFASRVDGKLELFQERFNDFYNNGFHKVQESTKEVPIIKESVKMLRDKGYKLVIATNPLFPQQAIYTRVRWAGFDPESFAYISTFEKNHYCKPQLQYYEEILEDINKNPEECLMVGNDVQEDLIVRKLGVKTYLITNHLLHRSNKEIETNYMGTYEDFYQYVKTLPEVD